MRVRANLSVGAHQADEVSEFAGNPKVSPALEDEYHRTSMLSKFNHVVRDKRVS